jgi:hypothetical protein
MAVCYWIPFHLLLASRLSSCPKFKILLNIHGRCWWDIYSIFFHTNWFNRYHGYAPVTAVQQLPNTPFGSLSSCMGIVATAKQSQRPGDGGVRECHSDAWHFDKSDRC